MKEADKKTKKEVQYEHPAKGPHHCGECVHFKSYRGTPTGSCSEVKGIIDKVDWCELFEEKK